MGEEDKKLPNGLEFSIVFEDAERPPGNPCAGIYVYFNYEKLSRAIGETAAQKIASETAQEFERRAVATGIVKEEEIPSKIIPHTITYGTTKVKRGKPETRDEDRPQQDFEMHEGPEYYCVDGERGYEVVKNLNALVDTMAAELKTSMREQKNKTHKAIKTTLSAHQGEKLTQDNIAKITDELVTALGKAR